LQYLDWNAPERIERSLRAARDSKDARAAMKALVNDYTGGGLWGVNVRMASAILTAIHPDRYTVVDIRALEALGVTNASPSVDFYVTEYLPACRDLAERLCKGRMRPLDRAMWQWSKNRSRSRKHASAYRLSDP